MDTFWHNTTDETVTTAEYLDQSAFDDKFEIEPDKDWMNNIYHIENKFKVPLLSGGFREMYAYASEHLIHPDDKDYHALMDPDTMMERFASSPETGMLRAEFRRKLVDGTYHWVQYIGIMGEQHGVPEGKIYFYIYDIQNQKDRQEGCSLAKREEDSRDPLTGLRNREVFVAYVRQKTAHYPGNWCCIAIDIQNFKIFNTWYGYDKGDYLLSRIGSYLAELEETDNAVAAYYGGDNFALLIPDDREKVKEIYETIRDMIFLYSNMPGFLPAFGVFLMENGDKPGFETYDNARLAVQEAKKSYTDRICYFDSTEYEKTRQNMQYLAALQNAMENDEITFYLQPQCRIQDGRIVGCEALARWIRKDGTIVPPGSFIPLLESSGFITELDKCVWNRVGKWIRSMLDRNITPMPVSINVSQIDLLTMDVAAYLYSMTETYHISPKYIKVEITESTYAENFDIMSTTVTELKRRGFTVFLDDFGSGYSSLNLLEKINVDLLKLDMLFMKKENSLGRKGISIVESIIGMTKALDMPVIVEGVETEEQIRFLMNLGVRYAQGYYFYRPISTSDFENLLAQNELLDRKGIQMSSADVFRAQEFLKENMFAESSLNRILGPVAYYTLESENLTITRFNQPFRIAIGDKQMDQRIENIQNYVVKQDQASLYQALRKAEQNPAEFGECEVRFYKSDGSVFWFFMQFYFLKNDGHRKTFFGKVEDITERREQTIYFFDVLRKQSDVTMCIALDQNTIQYVTGENTLYQVDLPSMDLEESVQRTAQHRIEKEADRKAFLEFFDPGRLREAYEKALYHEVLNIDFILSDKLEPVEFSTYYIRHNHDDSLYVYAFAKKRDREILSTDPLTGMGNRYAYNEAVSVLNQRRDKTDKLIVFSMDVNGLKSANDTYGHLAGDEMIKGAADAIQKVIGPFGNAYRIGGDEFAAFVYGDRELADFLKTDLYNETARWSGNQVSGVTISCGYATLEEIPDGSISDLIRTADLRMYRDKSMYYQQSGVNRRVQQVAYNAICNSYTKVLKVNLTEDSFEIIRADEQELKPECGYTGTFSGWLTEFARTDQVHPEDKEYYLQHTTLEYLRDYFREGKKQFCIYYRRRVFETEVMTGYDSLSCNLGGTESFHRVMLEMIPAPDYSAEQQKLFLYVKDISWDENA